MTTVHGGGNTVLVFTVSGSAANNYASDFSGAISLTTPVSTLSGGQAESTTPGALNIIYASNSSTGSFPTYTLTSPDQYTYVSSGTPVTVDGSSAGDTVFGGTNLTYIEAAGGHDNRVIFTSGDNTFTGSSDDSGDTIVAGTGTDTIDTGGGPSTVFAGGDGTNISLNDTVGGDVVVLQQGFSYIYANGVDDRISAGAGQGYITAGAGTLTFVAPGTTSTVYDYIQGGTGVVDAFGGNNLDLTLTGGGTQLFVAGAGNETLNGGASNGFVFFGDTNPGDSVNDSVVGGPGFDYFSTGAGTEYFQAGTGTDSFNINSIVGGATITINDFGGSDSVSFFAGSDSVGSVDGSNYVVKLSDGTTVEFLGINSLSGHIT